MNILKFPLGFILFLFLLSSSSSVVNSRNYCPTSYCSNNISNTFPIQYPFKLPQDQTPPNCSYYTDLKCTTTNNNNQRVPIINIPNLGDFYVRYIYYDYSIIQLYDPQNCLPKRLMSFNFSFWDSLFPVNYENYTFYNCPSDLIALSNFTVIDCLSNASVATVGTRSVSGQVMKKLYRCDEIATSLVPVSLLDPDDFIGNQNDFILRWFAPWCEYCPRGSRGKFS